jgi:hypothetical protein
VSAAVALLCLFPIPRSNAAAIPLGLGNIAELSVEFVEPPESNHLHFNRFPSEVDARLFF